MPVTPKQASAARRRILVDKAATYEDRIDAMLSRPAHASDGRWWFTTSGMDSEMIAYLLGYYTQLGWRVHLLESDERNRNDNALVFSDQ